MHKDIINIIKSYIDEKEFKKTVSTDKQLIAELKNVDKDYMLDCVLSYKLSIYFIGKYGGQMKYNKSFNVVRVPKDHKYNINILASIFIGLLQKYTYNDISNPKNVKLGDDLFNDGEEPKNLLEYITYLYNEFINTY